MKDVTVKQIIEVTNGKLLCGNPETIVEDFNTNSKEVKENTLFVPIIGENVDAHRFIDSALENCGAAFTQEHDSYSSDQCVIKVENTVKAMQEVGKWYLKKMNLSVIGVTGSVGKTTTREMIATALESQKTVFQTEKNYNSQVGVPMTIAKINPSDEIAVLEMGMSNEGEMVKLADIIRPDVGVVTCIGVSHIEQLKTQENICNEKFEIMHFMNEKNAMFINGDDAILKRKIKEIKVPVITFGLSDGVDYQGINLEVVNGVSTFTMKYKNKTCKVELTQLGEHNVRNALAALAICDYYQLDVEKAAKALYDFSGQRQRIVEQNGYTIIDDAYNASPDSMKAALGVLGVMKNSKRKIAVLADMLELGDHTVEYHKNVAEYVISNHIDMLFTYGNLAKNISDEVSGKTTIICRYFTDVEELKQAVKQEIKMNDAILFKGSNGMKLKEVVTYITES